MAALAVAGLAGSAQAQQSFTDEQQTLCQPDVFRLCNDAAPDQDRIVACMKTKVKDLSPDCRKVFQAGLSQKK